MNPAKLRIRLASVLETLEGVKGAGKEDRAKLEQAQTVLAIIVDVLTENAPERAA